MVKLLALALFFLYLSHPCAAAVPSREIFRGWLARHDPHAHTAALTYPDKLEPRDYLQYAWLTCQWRLAYDIAARLPEDRDEAFAITAALAALPWATPRLQMRLRAKEDVWSERQEEEIWADEEVVTTEPPDFCLNQAGPVRAGPNFAALVLYARRVFSDRVNKATLPLAVRIGTVPADIEGWRKLAPPESVWQEWLQAASEPAPPFQAPIKRPDATHLEIGLLPYSFAPPPDNVILAPWPWGYP